MVKQQGHMFVTIKPRLEPSSIKEPTLLPFLISLPKYLSLNGYEVCYED